MKTSDDGTLTNFNISVAVTDAFMANLQKYPNDLFQTKFGGESYHISKSNDTWTTDLSEEIYSNSDVWNLISQSASGSK